MMSTQRSVGRLRSRAALTAGVTGLAAILGAMASPGGASPRLEPSPTSEPRRVGMNSCAARGCHGAVGATDPGQGNVYIKDGAYTTWLNYDPHARAYDVLLESRSVAIADKLKGPLDGKPAHEAALCLSCHATVGPPEAKAPGVAPLRDGITCESCHGPAESWQDKHLALAWRNQPAAIKARDGMTDLGTPLARAGNCVGCHVGDRSRGMDMNHDLIAAGHPRLNFEFASYQAIYPKHWKEEHEKAGTSGGKATAAGDFEARSWAVGQVVTARAVLDLLTSRALASKGGAARKAPAPEAIWPEFSEYECFACHHGLTKPSPFQGPGHALGRPGRLPWATWPSAMLPELAKGRAGIDLDAAGSPWTELRTEMGRGVPDADKVAELAARGTRQLDALLEGLETEPFDSARVNSLLKEFTSRSPNAAEGWDRAAQHFLALSSLARAAKGLGVPIGPEVEAAIRGGSKPLDFPPDYDSPRSVSAPKLPPKP